MAGKTIKGVGRGFLPEDSPMLALARNFLGGGAEPDTPAPQEDPMSGWNRIAIQLSPMMPAANFDNLRARYFYSQVAPTLPAGVSSFAAFQDFKAKTERPQIVSPIVSGIGQLAASVMKGALPGPRSEDTFKPIFDVARADGSENPIANRVAEGAGGLGAAAALVEGAGVALGPTVAAMTQGIKGASLIQKAALGGLPFGAYDAAMAENGDRVRAGITGAIFGTVFGPKAPSLESLSAVRRAFTPFADAADKTAYEASLRYNDLENTAWMKAQGPQRAAEAMAAGPKLLAPGLGERLEAWPANREIYSPQQFNMPGGFQEALPAGPGEPPLLTEGEPLTKLPLRGARAPKPPEVQGIPAEKGPLFRDPATGQVRRQFFGPEGAATPESLQASLGRGAANTGFYAGTGQPLRGAGGRMLAPGAIPADVAVKALGADVDAARYVGFTPGPPEINPKMGGTAIAVLSDGRNITIGADPTDALISVSTHLGTGGGVNRIIAGPKATARMREFMVGLAGRLEEQYGGVPFYARTAADQAAVERLAAQGSPVISEGFSGKARVPESRPIGKPTLESETFQYPEGPQTFHSWNVRGQKFSIPSIGASLKPEEHLPYIEAAQDYLRLKGGGMDSTAAAEAAFPRVGIDATRLHNLDLTTAERAKAGIIDEWINRLSNYPETYQGFSGNAKVPEARYIVGSSPGELYDAFKRSQDVLKPKFANDVSEQAYRAGQIRNMVRMSGMKVGPPVPRELHAELHHILGDLTEQFGLPDRVQAGQLALKYFHGAAGDAAPADATSMFEDYMKPRLVGERAPEGYNPKRRLKGMTSGPSGPKTAGEAYDWFDEHVRGSIELKPGPVGLQGEVNPEQMRGIMGSPTAVVGVSLRGPHVPEGTITLVLHGEGADTYLHEQIHSGFYWADLAPETMGALSQHSSVNTVTSGLSRMLERSGYANTTVDHKLEEAFTHAADAIFMRDLGQPDKWQKMAEWVNHSVYKGRPPAGATGENVLTGWLHTTAERILGATKMSSDSVPLRGFQSHLEDIIRRTGSPIGGIQKRAQELGLHVTYYPAANSWEIVGGGKVQIFNHIAGVWNALAKDGRELMPDVMGQAIDVLKHSGQ